MVYDENTTKHTGNDRFYGYCIDLLADILNNTDPFTYEIYLVDQFGRKGENNEWSGMIGELQKKVSPSHL